MYIRMDKEILEKVNVGVLVSLPRVLHGLRAFLPEVMNMDTKKVLIDLLGV